LTSTAFSLRGTTVLRNDQRLLDAVDLSLPIGEPLIISGANGSGKTTLLRVLAGLMRISAGEGEVLGHPLPLSGSARRRVTAALDEPAFWPWMTAQSTLRTVADLSGRPAPDVGSILAEVGLDSSRFAIRRSKRVGRYSQGMRKRLQVACALAVAGDLLLVDEPTTSLDDEGRELVWEALRRRSERSTTVVVTTHDEDACDRLNARRVLLEGGRVLEGVEAGGHRGD
jgi:ABC-type multidrug transport system ATPase subunit